MTFYRLDEWFWAMFEPTWTLPNFSFGQLFMWIGANNDQIWLPMCYMSDSEQCSNRLELDLISLLVNFSCELGQIMTRYNFLWARWVILSNVRTDLNLNYYMYPNILPNLHKFFLFIIYLNCGINGLYLFRKIYPEMPWKSYWKCGTWKHIKTK